MMTMKPVLICLLTLALTSFVAGEASAKKRARPTEIRSHLRVPTKSSGQKMVQKFLDQGQFSKALAYWPQTFRNTRFGSSANGQAIFYYLAFRSGLENLALEELFKIKGLSRISKSVKLAWRRIAPKNHPVWVTAEVDFNRATRRIFPGVAGSRFRPFPIYTVKNRKRLSKIKKAVPRSGLDPHQEAFSRSQLGLWDAILNQPSSAMSALDRVSERDYYGTDRSRLNINRARVLYQRGNLREALDSYNRVSKGSDYWVESVEEKAWTYLRMKKPGKSLAQLRTLMTPYFENQVGPEPFYLAAFVGLKICDYPQVFKSIHKFKQTFRKRLPELNKLSKMGGTKAANKAVQRLVKGPYRLKSLGNVLGDMPRLFHRDLFVKYNVLKRRVYMKEAVLATKLYSRHRYRDLGKLKTLGEHKAENARVAIFKRLKFLADQDLYEMQDVLQRLHLVEAEVIQRMHGNQQARSNKKSEKRGRRRSRDNEIESGSDVLVFPDDDEVWMDELDNYHVAVKNCPPIGG